MGGPTLVNRLGLCGFASDRASVAIARFKTVFCILPGNTTVFLTLFIVPEVIRLIVLPIYPYSFTFPLLPFLHGIIVVFFLLQHDPNFLWRYSHIQPPEAMKDTLGCLG